MKGGFFAVHQVALGFVKYGAKKTIGKKTPLAAAGDEGDWAK
ncbi:hypothetical protein BN1221_02992c [Brenneria goodwinii]|uniref:Uncharacterized protein n=1 Tax=Brenneria goodwinii TaxID=1109412 RepID=A0A0G4JXR2_9GAMM|nr:hypothetical protein BN1221_02992c [Brenneria goodwinii]